MSAYILGRAGITPVDPDAALDREGFAGITMPNKDGFVEDPRGPDSY
jgi:S-disulfanyl-L-cysteine oxidoreductase SoxD